MNYFRMILFAAMMLFVIPKAEAQFLKKLKKKLEKTVENTTINKIDDKVQGATSDAIDKAFDPESMMKGGNPMLGGMNAADPESVPDSYDFEWKYIMSVETDGGKESSQPIDFYLKENAAYWGMGINQKDMNMTMVYDSNEDLSVVYMDQDGKKMMYAMKYDPKKLMEAAGEQPKVEYTITEIPGKTIQGYDCQGFIYENEDYHVTIYNTFEPGISLFDAFGKSEQLPTNFDKKWIMKDGKMGLVMEMIMHDKKENDSDVTMRCVGLEKDPFSVSKSDYETFSMNMKN
ncbi:DUF4412 domain-containing protein [Robertkochia solimangrovi]|uniref:DUF4412 domain-containing protein n=1 Tax=Robertkochia solimangrovi TaxID=2213046 RepID=UPI00117EE4A8|nr:DUF4412 domain-containing protein [Robertkochia solimangrovi]TRZ42851.1 hypothetical protein DMZ48_12335 [Robertkochia solimangrovi]